MTYVTDGKETFHKYYFNQNKQIVRKDTKKVLAVDQFGCIKLSNDADQPKKRSYNKLVKETFKEQFEPENINQYVDVFGFEDVYCFDPNNPNKVWNKLFKRFKTVQIDKDGYGVVELWKDGNIKQYRINRMVVESCAKQRMPEGYIAHHVSHNRLQNQYSNLRVLSKEQHDVLHIPDRAEGVRKKYGK